MSCGFCKLLGRRAGALGLAAGVLLLAGCTEDMSDLRSYVAEVKQRPGGRIEPLPEIQPYATYTFPERPMRNPFEPLSFGLPPEPQIAARTSGPRPDATRPREALEEFQLGVREGNYMGQNHGRITDITPREIQVRELVPTSQGGWIEREANLALND